MDALVQFVRDRLDDDEAFMQAAIRLRESGAVTSSPQAAEGAFALMDVVLNDPDTAHAITVFTRTGTRAPGEAERVLEEVAAKRQLLAKYEEVADNDVDQPYEYAYGYANALGDAVRLMALPYAEHPDYKEDWRP
ncbi:DUF6221 family protein [Streptomyces sp. NPDC056437]|uniref:DUF6221 family protein n=1 Tax=Streptomyces sp. NPDC056437 TaxID=3345816 RepID=UPI0036B78495